MPHLALMNLGLHSSLPLHSFTRKAAVAFTGALLVSALAVPLSAASVTVNAADNIYASGQSSTDNVGGGNLPVGIAVPLGATYIQVTNVTGSYTAANSGCASAVGCVTMNGGGNFNDADGVGAGTPTSMNTGTSSISGVSAPGAGELVGLYVASGGPSGTAPTALNYLPGGNASESASSYHPVLDQVFFIGDGLTGDGAGSLQTFYVPTGAKELYLGISDAGGYNGSPGAYGDNIGNYAVSYGFVGGVTPPPPPSSVPEPADFVLLFGGLSMTAAALRYRRKA